MFSWQVNLFLIAYYNFIYIEMVIFNETFTADK